MRHGGASRFGALLVKPVRTRITLHVRAWRCSAVRTDFTKGVLHRGCPLRYSMSRPSSRPPSRSSSRPTTPLGTGEEVLWRTLISIKHVISAHKPRCPLRLRCADEAPAASGLPDDFDPEALIMHLSSRNEDAVAALFMSALENRDSACRLLSHELDASGDRVLHRAAYLG
jgi:hypothetical protein